MHPIFMGKNMKLKSLKTYELDGVVLKPGSEFEASEHIAKQLIALKQAVPLDTEDNTEIVENKIDLSLYVSIVEHKALQAAFDAFKNSPDALKERLAQLELPESSQQQLDEKPKEALLDYSKLNIDELKVVLKEKGIEFKQSAKKDELLALIPKE